MSGALADPVRAWHQFWFAPQQTATLALFRIGFGILATVWTASQAPTLLSFYGPDGILPKSLPGPAGSWGVLEVWHGTTAVLVLFAITLAASVSLTLGLFSRVSAVLVLVGIVSFLHRDVLIANSGDGLVRNLAFLCALAPCGESLSLDRLRRFPARFWEFPERAPWVLRLVQVQLSIGYLTAVWDKSGNALWRQGTAVSYALRMQDIHRMPTPGFLTHSVLLVELLTYGSFAAELSLALLVWNRAARPWVLAVGVALHLSIDLNIMVGFFSYAVFCGYLAFVPPEVAVRVVLRVRDRLRGRLSTTQPVTPTSARVSARRRPTAPERTHADSAHRPA